MLSELERVLELADKMVSDLELEEAADFFDELAAQFESRSTAIHEDIEGKDA